MNTPPKLTDEQIEAATSSRLIADRYGYARAIESAVNQQWLDMLTAVPGVERIMELAGDWAYTAYKAYNDAVVNDHSGRSAAKSEKAETALRTAVEQALAARVPDEWKLVPDWKGYALLGTGNYVINHSSDFDPNLGAELIITLAGDKDREGSRQIAESRPNDPHAPPIQSDEMVIRIGFLNERGLFALEDQLREIRQLHFPDAAAPQPPQQPAALHRLMKKEGGAWLPASEWLPGEPDKTWVDLVNSDPAVYRIVKPLDGKEVADAFSKALAPQQPAEQPKYDPCPGCREGIVCRTPKCGRLKQRAAEQLRQQLAGRGEPVASPTAGMNIAQRILHVGGRNNAAGYVEFGSIQAVEALVRQVLRDLPESDELVRIRADVKTYREAMALVLTTPPDTDALLDQALEALEGVAQWVNQRPDTHPWDAWQRVDPAIDDIRKYRGLK